MKMLAGLGFFLGALLSASSALAQPSPPADLSGNLYPNVEVTTPVSPGGGVWVPPGVGVSGAPADLSGNLVDGLVITFPEGGLVVIPPGPKGKPKTITVKGKRLKFVKAPKPSVRKAN